jgi:hypothetical protein
MFFPTWRDMGGVESGGGQHGVLNTAASDSLR